MPCTRWHFPRKGRVILLFTFSTGWVLLIAYFSQILISPGPYHKGTDSIVSWFSNWDAGWYLSIVNDGYNYKRQEMSNIVFLPLYPFLIKLLADTTGISYAAAGIVISNLSLLLSVLLFDRLFPGKPESIRNSALMLFLFNPCRIFYGSVYTESLFLLLLLLTFCFTEMDRPFEATCIASLLALIRVNGFLTMLPIVYSVFSKSENRNIKNIVKHLYLMAPLLVVCVYFLFLYLSFGDFFAYMNAQKFGWRRGFVFPLLTLDKGMGAPGIKNFYRVIHYGALLAALFSVYSGVKQKFPIGWLLLIALYILLTLSSGRMESFARYISVLFPIYIIVAEALHNQEIAQKSLIISHAILCTFGIILFSRGYWFT